MKFGTKQQLIIIGLAIFAIVPLFIQNQFVIHILIIGLLYGSFAMAFGLAGIAGIFNGGIAAFIGIGAYASALFVINLGVSPFIGLLIGGAFGGLLGLFAGVITLRFFGLFLAMFTIFLSEALKYTFANLVWLTRGYLGLSVPPLIPIIRSRLPYFYIILAALLIIYYGLNKLVESKHGLAIRSMRENMEVSEVLGIDTVKLRVYIMTLSCAVAGFFGGIYAHYIRILTPDIMGFYFNILILAMAVVGGRATLWGGFIGAYIIILIQEVMRPFLGVWRFVLYGVLLIAVMVFAPDGVTGLKRYFSHLYTWIEKVAS